MAEWTHVDPDAIFIRQWPYTGRRRLYPLAPRPRGSVKATASSVKEAVSLYEARRNLSAGSTQVLEVPIQRWIKSKTDQLLPDDSLIYGSPWNHCTSRISSTNTARR